MPPKPERSRRDPARPAAAPARAAGQKPASSPAKPVRIPAAAPAPQPAPATATDFKLTVLSPRGRDAEQYFDQPVTPESSAHAPVNFHAFATCTGGSFQRETRKAIDE